MIKNKILKDMCIHSEVLTSQFGPTPGMSPTSSARQTIIHFFLPCFHHPTPPGAQVTMPAISSIHNHYRCIDLSIYRFIDYCTICAGECIGSRTRWLLIVALCSLLGRCVFPNPRGLMDLDKQTNIT